MWDESDYTARWIQGVCAVFLALFASVGAYMIYSSPILLVMLGGGAVVIASTRLSWRCARYAITGRGNVNRDDY